jgi:hypothetical protein
MRRRFLALDKSGATKEKLPKGLFWKTLSCPVTEKEFQVLAVKSNAYSVRGRDPDFNVQYDGINPTHYGVFVSPGGFAAEEGVFRRTPKLLFKDLDAVKARMKELKNLPDFNVERPLPLVCYSYELALGYIPYLRLPLSEKAGLALKAAWMYQDLAEKEDNEQAYKRAAELKEIAVDTYSEAYEKEDLSRTKIGGDGVGYLIGELLRQQGKFDDSLRWLSRIVTDKATGSEIKRMGRDQMDLCRQQREVAEKTGQYKRPEKQRTRERGMYQIYRDQVRWITKIAGEGELGESDIMRGFLDGIKNAKLDFSQFESEEKLAEFITGKLK